MEEKPRKVRTHYAKHLINAGLVIGTTVLLTGNPVSATGNGTSLATAMVECQSIPRADQRLDCYEQLTSQLVSRKLQLEANLALLELMDDIGNKVISNLNLSSRAEYGLTGSVRVEVGEDGEVMRVVTLSSSGSRNYDASLLRAVIAASPLPFPDNPRYYEYIRGFDLHFKPMGVEGGNHISSSLRSSVSP